MDPIDLIPWLLSGDVAIQHQVHRDLLNEPRPDLQARIPLEGWGARFLASRQPEGYWGQAFYQPKWTSTHYTLLDLRLLEFPRDHPVPQQAVAGILANQIGADGGVNPSRSIRQSDACINGMFLFYGCWFHAPESGLHSIVDFLIANHMRDGGFNCRLNRGGAVHSSMHTTLSILEGLLEYERSGCTYRLAELQAIVGEAQEFLLQHRLFRSDRTGDIIDPRFLLLAFPPRWYYDILRALDYFRAAGVSYDPRMQEALDVLLQKRRTDGTWPLQGRKPGQVHLDMEKQGAPSRWNTLRALRVLDRYLR